MPKLLEQPTSLHKIMLGSSLKLFSSLSGHPWTVMDLNAKVRFTSEKSEHNICDIFVDTIDQYNEVDHYTNHRRKSQCCQLNLIRRFHDINELSQIFMYVLYIELEFQSCMTCKFSSGITDNPCKQLTRAGHKKEMKELSQWLHDVLKTFAWHLSKVVLLWFLDPLWQGYY